MIGQAQGDASLTLGAMAKLGDLQGLQRKMRWESKSPNDPVSAHIYTTVFAQHCDTQLAIHVALR